MTTPEPQNEAVTDVMHAQIGVLSERMTSPPVTESDIRRWAIAVYWPELPPRLYWDTDYAESTPHGGIVAPQELNPFAWPVDWHDNHYNRVVLQSNEGRVRLFGGTDTTYFQPIRPGDVITSESRLSRIDERPGKDRTMLFYVTENRWTNQRDELVKIEMYTVIES